MANRLKTAITVALISTSLFALTACSSAVSIAGVWSASDGTPAKVIDENGACSGMYYNGGQLLDIGGGMTCTLSSSESGGYYTMVVQQPPNQISYQVAFDGDTMTLLSGGTEVVTLTRQ